MQQLESLYQQFLNFFPQAFHPYISVLLAVLLVYAIFQTLRRNFIFLIVLVVLLPASIPILKQVGEVLLAFIKKLLNF